MAVVPAGLTRAWPGLQFGLTSSPGVAAICFNAMDALYGIHHSGFSSNLLEVGVAMGRRVIRTRLIIICIDNH